MSEITPLPTPTLFSSKTTEKTNEVIGEVNDHEVRITALEEGGGGIPPEASWQTFTICDSGAPAEIQLLTRPVPPIP